MASSSPRAHLGWWIHEEHLISIESRTVFANKKGMLFFICHRGLEKKKLKTFLYISSSSSSRTYFCLGCCCMGRYMYIESHSFFLCKNGLFGVSASEWWALLIWKLPHWAPSIQDCTMTTLVSFVYMMPAQGILVKRGSGRMSHFTDFSYYTKTSFQEITNYHLIISLALQYQISILARF